MNVKGRKEEQRCKNMYVNTGVPVIDLNIVDRDTRGPMALDLALPAPREPSKIRRAVLLALPVPRAQILTTSVLPGNLCWFLSHPTCACAHVTHADALWLLRGGA